MSIFFRRQLLLALCSGLALAASGVQAQAPEAAAKLADAPARSVRLFVSGGMRAPVLAVRAQIEQATGHPVVIQSSESRTLQKEIEAGQPFEAALLTTDVVKDMAGKGRIVPGSEVPISVVRVGVAVRGSPPKQDISTPEGLKAAILGAHSIRRYYGNAASTPILDNLFAKLDLTATIQDKVVSLSSGSIPPEAPLETGQYELIINLITAVIPMKGWTYLGPIPEQFQMPLRHSAGLGAGGDHALGQKVIMVLEGPAFDAALKASGSQRR